MVRVSNPQDDETQCLYFAALPIYTTPNLRTRMQISQTRICSQQNIENISNVRIVFFFLHYINIRYFYCNFLLQILAHFKFDVSNVSVLFFFKLERRNKIFWPSGGTALKTDMTLL